MGIVKGFCKMSFVRWGAIVLSGGLLGGMLLPPSIAFADQNLSFSCSLRNAESSPVQSLIRPSKDDDYRVRRETTVKLREYGKAACPAVPELIELLKDWHPQVISAAADTLGGDKLRWHSSGATSQLQVLLKHQNAQVRSSAIYALGRISGALWDDRVIPDLVRGLKDPDARVRTSALQGLGEFTDWAKDTAQSTIDAIEPLFQDMNSDVRIAAIETFGTIVGYAPLDRWGPTVEPTLQMLFQSDDLSQKVAVINAWGVMNVSEAAPKLVPLLTGSRSELQYAAETSLIMMDHLDAEAVSQIVPLLKNANPKIRVSALRILGGVKADKRILDAIVPLIQDPIPQVRLTVASSLVPIRALSQEAIPGLLLLLQDSDARVRKTALMSLSMMSSSASSALPQITSSLTDTDPNVRAEAIWAMAFVGEKLRVLIPQAVVMLKDDHPRVRKNALFVIGLSRLKAKDSPELVSAILPLLQDSDRDVRKEAVEALKHLGYEAKP